MNWKERWIMYPQQVFVAVDQVLNALIPPFITLSWADETLSARTYRAAVRGKIVGKAAMPFINALFFWQGPDHCMHAYLKERSRANLPPEYR